MGVKIVRNASLCNLPYAALLSYDPRVSFEATSVCDRCSTCAAARESEAIVKQNVLLIG